MRRIYQRKNDDDQSLSGSVTVSIGDGSAVVSRREKSALATEFLDGADCVERALQRAIEVKETQGFARVVIELKHGALWQDSWGELV